MQKYQATMLMEWAKIIADAELKKTNKRIQDEKIWERASAIKKIYLEKADTFIKNNLRDYMDILFNPYKLFYFKQQKTTIGFYKEYLENETVKKYIPHMKEIFKTQQTIPELDQATENFTKGKIKTFFEFYYKAHLNRKEKLKNQIAIEMLRNDYNI